MSLKEAYAIWFAARQDLGVISKEVRDKHQELETKLSMAQAREERAFRVVETALVQEPPPDFRLVGRNEIAGVPFDGD